MGDMADYYIQQEIDAMIDCEDAIYGHPKPKRDLRQYLEKKLWPTKDKGDIKISDMSAQHLNNALNKCKRDNWRTSFIPLLEEELNKREQYPWMKE